MAKTFSTRDVGICDHSRYNTDGMDLIIYIVLVIVVILFSMTFHEAMHGFVSYWLGDDTARREGRLTLNPIKHIDPFLTLILPLMLAVVGAPIFGGAKPVPFNPYNLRWSEWGVALVAIAGPLTNLLIAFVATGVWVLVGMPVAESLAGRALQLLIQVNLGFFVFNMIPIPPLDGSRVLYALAPEPVQRGMQFIEQYGIFVVFGIVLIAGQYLGVFIYSIVSWLFDLFVGLFQLI